MGAADRALRAAQSVDHRRPGSVPHPDPMRSPNANLARYAPPRRAMPPLTPADIRALPPVTRRLYPGDQVWITYSRRLPRRGVVMSDDGGERVVVGYQPDTSCPVARKRLRYRT